MIDTLKTCLISLILYSCCVSADFIIEELNDDTSLCANICIENSSLLSVVNNGKSICEKGCRFFNIIYLTDQNNINSTQLQCYSSCKEAYSSANDDAACINGCNAMSKKKEEELTNILAFIRQENSKNFLLETEIEILESDILSDPMIKNQIEQGGNNVQYHIPETKIRTMPIAEIIERRIYEARTRPPGDWLDCASRNSGIPKSVLLTAMLIATLIVLLLLMTSARYKTQEHLASNNMQRMRRTSYEVEVNYEDEKRADLPTIEEKRTGDTAALIDNEIQFSEPFKHDIGTCKV